MSSYVFDSSPIPDISVNPRLPIDYGDLTSFFFFSTEAELTVLLSESDERCISAILLFCTLADSSGVMSILRSITFHMALTYITKLIISVSPSSFSLPFLNNLYRFLDYLFMHLQKQHFDASKRFMKQLSLSGFRILVSSSVDSS